MAEPPADLLWGVPEIAKYIKRTERQTYYLIAKGVVPAKRFGHRIIVARSSDIDRQFSHRSRNEREP